MASRSAARREHEQSGLWFRRPRKESFIRACSKPGFATLAVMGICLSIGAIPASAAADDFWRALTEGQPDLYLRYRYEHVEDDALPPIDEADANTLRTALGYRTGAFYGFYAYLQLEDVRAIDLAQSEEGIGAGARHRRGKGKGQTRGASRLAHQYHALDTDDFVHDGRLSWADVGLARYVP